MMTVSPSIEVLLPTRTQDLLNSCPEAGAGVHKWLIKVAVRLHPFFANEEDIAELLWKYSANCGREIEDREVWAAINNSRRWLQGNQGQTRNRESTSPTSKRNEELIKSIV
ncbi:MAG TPA: hypothetical protein VM260_15495, partial [Pirellula sp.]|nr:hypothetical protein [Pirellula sp.]